MEKNFKFYWKLFTSTFMLSAFTFGGGFVIIPLMRKKFVDELKWIKDKEILDLTAIAQSSPGAVAVNASILIGYRLAGVPGSLLTVLGTVLPPLITLSVVALFYAQFRSSVIVSRVLQGMKAGVAAVIVDVVYMLGKDVIKRRELIPIAVMLLAFVAASILHLNVMVIVLASGIIGAAMHLIKNRPGKIGGDQ